jgi:hypothetical protein
VRLSNRTAWSTEKEDDMGLVGSLFMTVGMFLVVIGALGALVTLLFGTLWADRRATPGTVVRSERKAP